MIFTARTYAEWYYMYLENNHVLAEKEALTSSLQVLVARP